MWLPLTGSARIVGFNLEVTMNRSISHALIIGGIATLALLGCGEDDDPVAGDSPCADANSRCASFRMHGEDISIFEFFDVGVNQTAVSGEWPVDGKVVVGYAPGRRMIVTLTFDDPIEVSYDLPYLHLSFIASLSPGFSYNRFANATVDVKTTGTIAVPMSSVEIRGASGGGESYLGFASTFDSPSEGQTLRSIEWSMVVPETYTTGAASGTPILPGDLPVTFLAWSTTLDGDRRGDPPIMQGAEPR